jgi:hypothetical protein
VFIDFKAACDSIDRCNLYTAMEEFQIPHKLIILVKTITKNTSSEVKIQNIMSQPIHIKNGLPQGDVLVCLLFNTALDRVMRYAGIWGSNFYKSVQIMAHANDIDIIKRTQRVMKEAFISLEKAAKKMHLRLARKKHTYSNN